MAQSLSYGKWLHKYYIVFTQKYRRKVIHYQLRADIQRIIKDLCIRGGDFIYFSMMFIEHIKAI